MTYDLTNGANVRQIVLGNGEHVCPRKGQTMTLVFCNYFSGDAALWVVLDGPGDRSVFYNGALLQTIDVGPDWIGIPEDKD